MIRGSRGLLEEVRKLLFPPPDFDVKFNVCGLRYSIHPDAGGESAYCQIVGQCLRLIRNGSELDACVFCLTDIREEMIHG